MCEWLGINIKKASLSSIGQLIGCRQGTTMVGGVHMDGIKRTVRILKPIITISVSYTHNTLPTKRIMYI